MVIELYPDSEPARRAHLKMQIDVAALYIDRQKAKGRKRREIEKRINEAVENWNLKWGKGPNYFDLHGMTLQGAKTFVARMILRAEKPKLYFEVGQGHHSFNGIPLIKLGLLNKYRKAISVCEWNKGILVLNVSKVMNGHY
ncbi:hypothetical protein CAEBREN_06480 [Caenorhabditis brenneri]|uniref:Smr domain-containing protein n=1 Tax=Caenorhabditis brenneri TaxID=135651 RepID=G0MCK9_CAEBE|nr:hypothetical protein CAEBREN_06480 [Caenorhabditis brenneri]